mmetsp:Transcript_30202/g.56061  ORF Transcript_30202/g.56061 Transcript_30202/m.56061 type:complete len:120 (-) Transcript_30202:290-649(-)
MWACFFPERVASADLHFRNSASMLDTRGSEWIEVGDVDVELFSVVDRDDGVGETPRGTGTVRHGREGGTGETDTGRRISTGDDASSRPNTGDASSCDEVSILFDGDGADGLSEIVSPFP